jgi:hypothetical protein
LYINTLAVIPVGPMPERPPESGIILLFIEVGQGGDSPRILDKGESQSDLFYGFGDVCFRHTQLKINTCHSSSEFLEMFDFGAIRFNLPSG